MEDVSILMAGEAARQTVWAERLDRRLRAALKAGIPVVLVADQGDAAQIRGVTALLLKGWAAERLLALPAADYTDSHGQIRLKNVAGAMAQRLPQLGQKPALSLYTNDPSRFHDLTRFALVQLTITFLDGREVRLLKDVLDRFRAELIAATNA